MQITLPPEAQAIIENEIASGRFDTEEQAIVEAIFLLREMSLPYDPMSDPELLKSVAQADRGEVLEWNDALRAEIKRQAMEDARLGKPVPDDIKY
jgi:hypothetical protein